MSLLLKLLITSVLFIQIESAKILIAVPMPSHSHFTIAFRIAKELADKGHEVTCINPYPQKKPLKNYVDVPIVEVIDFLDQFKKKLFEMDKMGVIGNQHVIFELGNGVTRETLKNKNVQQLLKSNQKFDVVLIEYFLNDALVGLGHHFNAPVIFVSAMGTGFCGHMVGLPIPSSYVPNLITDYVHPMSFIERVQNFALNIYGEYAREAYFFPEQRKIFNEAFKSHVSLDTLIYNVSLILSNSHESVQDAVPTVPNIIEIGGYHLSPVKPLPADLQQFLDTSPEGVVLFSMGSNLKSKDLKPEARAGLLKAFSKLKQKVLWKFEEQLPEAPKNVKVMSWVPQNDVLAHKNVKAFITHGGLLSTIETVHHGVPIIGIPVFGDQKSNIALAERKGYAVGVPLDELSEEKLSWALNEVLNNPKYRENVQKRSKLIRDRPLAPIDTATYWVEFVAKHGGAPHLRTGALDLTWYQRHMIDIILVLSLVTIVLFVVFYLIIKKILGLCFGNKKQVSGKKQKKQ